MLSAREEMRYVNRWLLPAGLPGMEALVTGASRAWRGSMLIYFRINAAAHPPL